MKLNPDCIRDILIAGEEVITFNNWYYYEKDNQSALSQKYSHDEIIYHIRQARDSGLITIGPFTMPETLCILPTSPPQATNFLQISELILSGIN